MACICVRGIIQDKINFPVSDYTTHAQMLQAMAVDDLARQLRTQAGATGNRQEKTTVYQGIRGKQCGGSNAGKWEAVIRVAGKSVYLGIYDTDIEAAQAYDQAAILRWAQGVGATSHADSTTSQASLNFPLENYSHLLVDLDTSPPAVANSSGSAPVLLGKRYVETVLQACRHFIATSETLKNALATSS
jgi:hypothetical protein